MKRLNFSRGYKNQSTQSQFDYVELLSNNKSMYRMNLYSKFKKINYTMYLFKTLLFVMMTIKKYYHSFYHRLRV